MHNNERFYSMQQPNGFTGELTGQNEKHRLNRDNSEDWRQTMQTQSDPEFGAMQEQSAPNSAQANNFAQNGYTISGNFAGINDGQWLDLSKAKYWFSLLGGIYLAIYGLKRSLGSLTIASVGLGLVYYAWTGQWPLSGRLGNAQANQGGRRTASTGSSTPGLSGISPLNALHTTNDSTSTKNIIVKAPLNEVYQAWANFENFPNFMRHIKSVTKTGDRTSHWVMEGPLNTQIEWDAETTRQEENKRIAWNSINGDIKTSGQVTFNALPDNQVEVTVMLKYVPPAGLAGEIVAELFGNPEGKLLEDLRNFKRDIEAKQAQPA